MGYYSNHAGRPLGRKARRSIGDCGANLGLHRSPTEDIETAGIYEYTLFCNGPDEVKSASDRHAAELTLLSVVSAEAATLCC
jgi:hypothetical protein